MPNTRTPSVAGAPPGSNARWGSLLSLLSVSGETPSLFSLPLKTLTIAPSYGSLRLFSFTSGLIDGLYPFFLPAAFVGNKGDRNRCKLEGLRTLGIEKAGSTHEIDESGPENTHAQKLLRGILPSQGACLLRTGSKEAEAVTVGYLSLF